MSNSVALLIARILLSLLFLMGGLEKFSAIEGTAGYIAAYGFPASTLLAWLAAIFETVAGIAILIGFQTRLAAYALAAFCLFTAAIFHFEPDNVMQMLMLMKNIGLAGGFLALSVAGAGSISVDGKRAGA
ncbi:MAG: DoxX family protein [Nitratireductor sp.]|nr:DoxX family protein [Nitratireductor sp.]